MPPQQVAVLAAELGGVALVEVQCVVQFLVTAARRIRAQAANALRPVLEIEISAGFLIFEL